MEVLGSAPGETRLEVTDREGRYRIDDLLPGAYAVWFTLPGFQWVVGDRDVDVGVVDVGAGRVTTADAEMAITWSPNQPLPQLPKTWLLRTSTLSRASTYRRPRGKNYNAVSQVDRPDSAAKVSTAQRSTRHRRKWAMSSGAGSVHPSRPQRRKASLLGIATNCPARQLYGEIGERPGDHPHVVRTPEHARGHTSAAWNHFVLEVIHGLSVPSQGFLRGSPR